MIHKKRFVVLSCILSASLLAGSIGFAARNRAQAADNTNNLTTNAFLPDAEIFPQEQTKKTTLTSAQSTKLAQMELIAQNEYLNLYFDKTETSVAVEKKSTGQVWFSNPVDVESDTIASPYAKQRLKSQFTVRYYNESVQSAEMDNYNDSIMEGQFEVSYQDQGVTITYTLGNTGTKLILPQVISEEKFDALIAQMDEKAVKQIKRNYTLLNWETMKDSDKDTYSEMYSSVKEHNIYILKSGTKEYKQEELMGYFTGVGYTLEDMIADMQENGYEAEVNDPYFIIPLHYQLDGENLLAWVVPNEIEYNTNGFHLIGIDLLENFGAASAQEDGYLFVPDGSGALIYYNNGKTSRQSYTAQVYGADWSVNFLSEKKPEYDSNLSIKLPVFGAVTNDQAFLAILEDGEAMASVNADISGKINSYNTVYAGFLYLQNGPISLGDIIGNNSFQMYADRPYEGDFKIRYAFLSGNNASYSGMANYYRRYLVEQGVLKRQEVSEQLPFYVEYIGAIDKSKSILGVKYDATIALTTFDQAKEIGLQLKQAGIENQKVRFSAWMNGGISNTAPLKISPVSAVEKKLDAKDYAAQMKKEGIEVFFDTEFQEVHEDKLFDGYTSGSQAPRYFDKTVVRTGKYLIPNGFIMKKNVDLISPYYLDSILKKYLKSAKKYNFAAVSAGGLASNVYSDFMNSRYTDRQQAADFNEAGLKKISDAYEGRLMGENAAGFAFSTLSDIVKAPMDSNNFQILDESIPFYEMVVRGYIEYTGNPINLSDDAEWTILKNIETGAGLYYQWCYADNSLVKETDYSYLYSIHYNYWMKEAIEQYQKMNEVFKNLQGQSIIGHEKLADGVYLVTYEKGTQIGVNYNETVYKQNGIQIDSKDFCVVKEGK